MTTDHTDLELLTLAAKAADIRYDSESSKPNAVSGAFFGLWKVFDGEPSEYARRYWNPLTDDGDAFRLAVKLQMTICIYDSFTEIHAFGVSHITESHTEGSERATRLAIVRAAAEMGESE